MNIAPVILAFARCLPLLGFIVSGCSTPEERATPQVTKVQPAPVSIKGKTDTVRIMAMKFVPAEVTVVPGTTVVFINEDMVTHDITEEITKSWSSNLLPPSKSWSMIANKSDNYYCSIHAVMKGRIIVAR